MKLRTMIIGGGIAVLALGAAFYGAVGYLAYSVGETVYDNTNYGMQNNAVTHVFNQNMDNGTAARYLASHGFSPAQAKKFGDCKDLNAGANDLSQSQIETNVRNCMLSPG